MYIIICYKIVEGDRTEITETAGIDRLKLCAEGAHHMLLTTPTPEGTEVNGVCKHCGIKKTYPPSNRDVPWSERVNFENTIRGYHDLDLSGTVRMTTRERPEDY